MKKGISPVIATILLVVISVVAVMIIAGIVIPFVRDSPDRAKKCFEAVEAVEIVSSEYTCYYNISTIRMFNISVKRKMKDVELEGFILAVSGGGEGETFEIKEGTVENVRMINGSSILIIPARGETKTYSMNSSLTVIDYAEIAPILKGGDVCDATGISDLEECIAW
jgi:flagellin-like protein